MRIAKKYDLPIILHTRKAEERVLELLIESLIDSRLRRRQGSS